MIPLTDAWIIACLRSSKPVSANDLSLVSDAFRPLVERLVGLPIVSREHAWETILAARPDRDDLMRAVADADPDGPRPEASEGDDDEPDEDWGMIRLANLPRADPFPLEILPEPARDFAKAVAWSIGGSPVDFAALGVLVAACAAIGNSCRVRIKSGYFQSASLYAIGIGRSSDGKSPAFHAALHIIWAIQERLRAEWKRDLERWEAIPEGEQGSRPVLKRIATSSPTCEALGGILRSNPRGMIVLPDEMTGWLAGMNQYKAKGNDRQFWLSGWGGETVYIDRAKDKEEPIAVPRPFLSVVGGMTPGDLKSLDRSGTAGDGFTARLLIVYPDTKRRTYNDDGIHPGVEGDYARMIERLFARSMPTGDDGLPEARVVSIADDARPMLAEWFDQHQAETEAHGFPESLVAHWGKLEAYLYRLVLILHLLDLASGSDDPDADIPPIPRTTIDRAMRLVGYLKSHARRVHHVMNRRETDGGDDVQALLKWIVGSNRREFSTRDIGCNFNRFKDDPASLQDALKWMTERNLIRPIEPPAGARRGRKSTPRFEANPELWDRLRYLQNHQNNSPARHSEGIEGFEGTSGENQ